MEKKNQTFIFTFSLSFSSFILLNGKTPSHLQAGLKAFCKECQTWKHHFLFCIFSSPKMLRTWTKNFMCKYITDRQLKEEL